MTEQGAEPEVHMPPIAEQLAIEGSETADFTVSRFLLKPGRTYEASVEQFSPYKVIQHRVDEARTATEKIWRRRS